MKCLRLELQEGSVGQYLHGSPGIELSVGGPDRGVVVVVEGMLGEKGSDSEVEYHKMGYTQICFCQRVFDCDAARSEFPTRLSASRDMNPHSRARISTKSAISKPLDAGGFRSKVGE